MSFHAYRGISPTIHPSVFVAEGARIVGDVEIGEGSSLWFNSVVRGDVNRIRIGARTNVQDLCILHVTHEHPCILGDEVTVGHHVTLHGATVGNGALIGMGAILLDGVEIGEECLVAAGALVPPGLKVPARSLVMGFPAKVVRPLSPAEAQKGRQGAMNYVKYAADYGANRGKTRNLKLENRTNLES